MKSGDAVCLKGYDIAIPTGTLGIVRESDLGAYAEVMFYGHPEPRVVRQDVLELVNITGFEPVLFDMPDGQPGEELASN